MPDENGRPTDGELNTADPLSTGIDILDRKLGGGIPPGRTVAIAAAPASQSEALLYELATRRETAYVTTMRSAESVEAEFAALDAATGPTPKVVGLDGAEAFEEVPDLVERLPERAHLIVDPTRPLEARTVDAYRSFLVELRGALAETDSVAYLHCLDGVDVPARRDDTQYFADVVFDVTTERNGDAVETYLSVPKFRRGHAPEEVVKLDLSRGVSVDFSRNIV